MAKTLNLETFNEILFSALEDIGPKGKAGLLEAEISTAYAAKIMAMEQVIKDLNESNGYGEHLRAVNNIDASLDALGAQLDEIYAANPGLEEELEKDETQPK